MPKRRTMAPDTRLAELRETVAAGTAPVEALRTALADPIDCADVTFFLAALRYRQPEPTWGGSQDTADRIWPEDS